LQVNKQARFKVKKISNFIFYDNFRDLLALSGVHLGSVQTTVVRD
jgi:hypothetical protein